LVSPGQPRQQVAQLGQLDLELALVGAGPAAEDVQDDLGPVDDPHPQCLLQVAALARAQPDVEDDQVGALVLGQPTDLLDLALADVGLGIDRGPDLEDLVQDLGAGGPNQAFELAQRFLGLDLLSGVSGQADQDGFFHAYLKLVSRLINPIPLSAWRRDTSRGETSSPLGASLTP
jgi:hypothetical protein